MKLALYDIDGVLANDDHRVQLALEKHPDLPNIPLILDLANTPEQKQIFTLIFSRQVLDPTRGAVWGLPRLQERPRRRSMSSRSSRRIARWWSARSARWSRRR